MDTTWFRDEAQKLSPALYRMAVSILRSSYDAQDAVQEALLKCWAARDRCRKETFGPYLMRILINECRNVQRYRMRQTPVGSMPEEAAPREDIDIDLKNALEQLPDSLRIPLLLKYMDGWPDAMISKALGITGLAVRGRLHRARKALKSILERGNGNEALG